MSVSRDIKNKEFETEFIPEGWRILELNEAIEFNPKREIKRGLVSKFVSMADVETYTKKVRSFSEKEFSGGMKFKNGDTIMARITPCLENGKTSFIDFLENDEVAGGSTEFIVLTGKREVSSSDFVYYLSISPKIRGIAIKAMSGTSGRQRVDNSKFLNHIIALPPFSEQQRIAEILSSLDDKIELNRKINDNLEKIVSSLFKRWFVDFEFPNKDGKPYKSSGGKMINSELGKIPDEWSVKKMKDITSFIDRGIAPKYTSDGILVINQKCIRNGLIDLQSVQYAERPKMKNDARLLRSFDILINSMGVGTLGRVSRSLVVNDDIWVHNCITIIRSNLECKQEFLFQLIKIIEKDIESLGEGTTGQTSLKKELLENIKFVIPPIYLQERFSSMQNNFNLYLNKNLKEIKNLQLIRDSLLPKLMSGKIRVK